MPGRDLMFRGINVSEDRFSGQQVCVSSCLPVTFIEQLLIRCTSMELPSRETLRASEAKTPGSLGLGGLCQYLLSPPEGSTLHQITLCLLTWVSFQFAPVPTSGCGIGGTPHRIQLPESLCSSALCSESLGGISLQNLMKTLIQHLSLVPAVSMLTFQ